jgi:hypothetical protein
MDVKGTAFLARKVMLIEEIGEDRFNQIVSEIAKKEPIFERPIHATTLIPMGVFVAFNDALIDQLYGGDRTAYIRFGEKSAEYALMIGPYKRIRETNSVAVFVDSARFIYQGYYTAGRAEGTFQGDVAELRLHGVPSENHHLYLEYASAGYLRRGIEIMSMHGVTMTCLRGFSRGDDDVHYRYAIERTAAPSPTHPGRGPRSSPPLPPSAK